MLKVSGDGRRAALDLRLVGLPQAVPGKVAAAADRIAAIWEAHRDDEYQAPDGTSYPVRGSLQLVFCDLGTPGPGWNVYHELRDQLAAARAAPGDRPVRARGEDRYRPGPAVRRVPVRARRRPDRLDREDGRRHQRARPRRGPAPPRRSLASRRRRPARRTHHPPGQPERGSPGHPLPDGPELRRVHVADPGTQGPLHPRRHVTLPGHPGDRGHRRHRAVVQRSQGPGDEQPAADGQGRSRRRPVPPRPRRTRSSAQPGHPAPLHHPAGTAHRDPDPAGQRHRRRDRPAAGHPRRRVHHDRRRPRLPQARQTRACTCSTCSGKRQRTSWVPGSAPFAPGNWAASH